MFSASKLPKVTYSEMDLCDECWCELLAWANQPEQERLKIAAENRRRAARVEKIQLDRRERAIAELMKDESDLGVV